MEALKIGRKSGVSPIDLKSCTVVIGPIRNTKSAWERKNNTIAFFPYNRVPVYCIHGPCVLQASSRNCFNLLECEQTSLNMRTELQI